MLPPQKRVYLPGGTALTSGLRLSRRLIWPPLTCQPSRVGPGRYRGALLSSPENLGSALYQGWMADGSR